MPNTYLVTGGAGFIGRHLCAELLHQGHRIRVIDSLVDQVHDAANVALAEDIEFCRADIRDGEVVARMLDGVDGVFHLAAEVGVGQSMYEVSRYVGGNDLATAVLLEQLIRRPVARLVVASSMSVYGEGLYQTADGEVAPRVRRVPGEGAGRWDPVMPDGRLVTPVPTDETKPVDLASIYALTKYAQERSCLIVGGAYGIDVVALRLFNVFGPGQALSNPYTGVLANFGSRLLNGQPPMIFEDGLQQRDFVHVADVVQGFCLAMQRPEAPGHVVNIGSGQAYTIERVATLLADAMDLSHLQPKLLGKARAGDIRHCFANIGKARTLLGYAPTRLLEDAIDEVAAWIRSSDARDHGEDAKRQLELHGLVA
jgi:dTDP-L-rhamnose 4-epimerase